MSFTPPYLALKGSQTALIEESWHDVTHKLLGLVNTKSYLENDV